MGFQTEKNSIREAPIRISKQNYPTAPKFESANLKISRVPKFAFKENIGNPSHL